MTIQFGWGIQVDVVGALMEAFPGIPVVSSPAPSHPRHIRVDGFTVVNDELYKDTETGTHHFFVHALDAPAGGTNSLQWVRQALAIADTALTNRRFAGGVVRAEDSQAIFEPKTAEGVYDAHGFTRYRLQTGV